MNEWISVKDKLPDYGEEVLAILSGRPNEFVTLMEAYMLAAYYPEAWFVDEYPDWDDAQVSYWMPLPEPPKEVDNDAT